MIAKVLLAASTTLLLAACASTPAPRTAEAECRIFAGPPHVIATVTRRGQIWVDQVIEAGVRVCGWDRPGAPSPDEVLIAIGSGRWLPDPLADPIRPRDPSGFVVRGSI